VLFETVETETLSSFAICLRVALTFIIKVCVDFINNLLEMHLTKYMVFQLLADSYFLGNSYLSRYFCNIKIYFDNKSNIKP
jgi:hypothetical protein